MKILFIGKASSSAGGPSAVMQILKNYLEENFNDDVKIIDSDFSRKTFLSPKKLKKMHEEILKAEVINFHEFWNPSIIQLAKKATSLGTPYFFTFHGVLNEWSLRQNSFLKKVFLNFFGKNLFKNAAGFQFLTEEEYLEAKDLYNNFQVKSFVLQNGLDIKNVEIAKKPKEENFLKILYLGRMHPKKGLEVLLDSLNFFKENRKNIFFRLVGPESKYGEQLKKKILENKLEKYVSIEGPIYNLEKKIELFSDSDFFILPSYDEADSMALKESVAYGLPIIVTKECKFFDVEKNKIGYFIDHKPIKIYEKFSTINTDSSEIVKMSEHCKKFAEKIFDINSVGIFYRENLSEIASGVKYSVNWKINDN